MMIINNKQETKQNIMKLEMEVELQNFWTFRGQIQRKS